MSTTVSHDYNALFTTTLQQVSPKLDDIISKEIPFLMWLEKKGRKKVSGGSEIRRTVSPRFNTDGGAFGKWDTISATDQNPVEPAIWQWGHYVKPVILSHQEAAHNSGKEQIIDLGKAKMEQAKMSIKKDLHLACLGNGRGSADELEGLKTFADKDTLASDSYGGLSRATYSTWKPYDKGSAVGACYSSSTENLVNAMTTGYLTMASEGQGNPDLILTSITGAGYYEQRAFNKMQIQIADTKIAELGFEAWKFKGATMIADPYLNSAEGTNQGSGETFYFLNSKTWEMVQQSGWVYKVIGPKEMEEQAGVRWDIFYFAQMICTNPRANGLLYGVTAQA